MSKALRIVWGSLIMLSAAGASLAAEEGKAALREGWIRAGSAPVDFDMGTDRTTAHDGSASGYLKSKVAKPKGFGTLMQMFKGDEFHGQRVRMSGWVKADKVNGWAGLWMRVDGQDMKMTAFDNMQSRPIKGTAAWTHHEIVLDVAPDTRDIAFGILLDGTGAVWLDQIHFEVVDKSVPTTGGSSGPELARAPTNLDFEK